MPSKRKPTKWHPTRETTAGTDPRTKLSQEDLNRLFDDWDTGKFLQRELGAKYGICQQRVSQLLRWRRKKEFKHFYPRSKFFKELCRKDAGYTPGGK